MDRKIMFDHANSCKYDYAKIKESVFGLLPNIIKSVQGSEIGPIREVFSYISKMEHGQKKNYMGVKLCQLQYAITVLYAFNHNHVILPDQTFGGYTKQDLLGYTEICRRMHKVRYGMKNHYNTNVDGAATETGHDKKKEYGSFELKIKIAEKNLEAAEYLIKNKDKFQDKQLLRQAEEIIGKKK